MIRPAWVVMAFEKVLYMDFIEQIDPASVRPLTPIAESDQFAIYAQENDAYILVQRHAATPWTAVRFSGDGLFRVGELMVSAMRHLYRDVASTPGLRTLAKR